MRISTHTGTFNGTSTFNPEFTWATGWGAGNLFTLVDFVGRDPNNPTELDGLADVHTLVDVTGDGQPDLVTRVKATGELHYISHAPVWNPGAPSTLFDPARDQLLGSGWNGYRLVA